VFIVMMTIWIWDFTTNSSPGWVDIGKGDRYINAARCDISFTFPPATHSFPFLLMHFCGKPLPIFFSHRDFLPLYRAGFKFIYLTQPLIISLLLNFTLCFLIKNLGRGFKVMVFSINFVLF